MPHTSLTGPVDVTGWWRCCYVFSSGEKCSYEVSPEWENICPLCGHERCQECEEIEQPPAPIQPAEQHHPHTRLQVYHFADENFAHNHYGESLYPGQGNVLPTFTGWWQCSECGREVNSAWSGWECPDCGHSYNPYCCTTL